MYPTNEEKKWAISLMEKLFDLNFEYALTYHKESDMNYYRLGLYEWLASHRSNTDDFHIGFFSGETKVCIIDRDGNHSDWVIKIPFKRDTNPTFVEEGFDENFCELEVINYVKACDNNLNEYFAETYKIGEISDTPIYLQEKVDCSDEIFHSLFFDYFAWERKDLDPDAYVEWVEGYIEDMDDSERIEAIFGADSDSLIEFVEENHINDLHENNWGITKNGKYVILDFSGYGSKKEMTWS